MNPNESVILTIKEAAEWPNVTERTIYRVATRPFKVGGMWRCPTTAIKGWIAYEPKKAKGTD